MWKCTCEISYHQRVWPWTKAMGNGLILSETYHVGVLTSCAAVPNHASFHRYGNTCHSRCPFTLDRPCQVNILCGIQIYEICEKHCPNWKKISLNQDLSFDSHFSAKESAIFFNLWDHLCLPTSDRITLTRILLIHEPYQGQLTDLSGISNI